MFLYVFCVDYSDDLGRFLAKLDQTSHEPVQADIPEDDRNELLSWQRVVTRTLVGLAAKTSEHIWPRDTLFEYLRAMEQMQNNIKEYQDLQYLAGNHHFIFTSLTYLILMMCWLVAIALHEMYSHRTLRSSTKSGIAAISASTA
jgi:nitrogen fixation/metabolism regulation signal transduction histidine kinase